jgi:hypothetical protein
MFMGRLWAKSFLRRIFAATPPAITTLFGVYSLNASMVFSTTIETAVFSKQAAISFFCSSVKHFG